MKDRSTLKRIIKAVADVFPEGHPDVKRIKKALETESTSKVKEAIKELLNNHQFPSTWHFWHSWHKNIIDVLEGAPEADPNNIRMPKDAIAAIRESWLLNRSSGKYTDLHYTANPVASSSDAPAPLQGIVSNPLPPLGMGMEDELPPPVLLQGIVGNNLPPALPLPFWQQHVIPPQAPLPQISPALMLLSLFSNALAREALQKDPEIKRCEETIRGVMRTGNEWYMGQVAELILMQYCHHEDIAPWVDTAMQRLKAAGRGDDVLRPIVAVDDLATTMSDNVGRQMATLMRHPGAAKQFTKKLSEIPLYCSERHWQDTDRQRKENGRDDGNHRG